MSKARSLNVLHADLDGLLAAHGLAGVRGQPIAHTGFSGSHLSRLVRDDGVSFVLKRMSIDRDWIMRATNDDGCREAQFSASSPPLPRSVRAPYVGAATDGGGFALLMTDIAKELIPPDLSPITEQELDRILRAMAQLHASPAPDVPVSWCGLQDRLMLLTPSTARIAATYGAHVAQDVTRGWSLFADLAPPAAVSLIHRLFDDPLPLLHALDALPPAFLHGDLKFDNIGLAADGAMWLIDWAMTLVAPAAVDLGWFLAINSRRVPVALDDVLEGYAAAAGLPEAARRHQEAVTVLCGLLLRGWRKALDAEAGEPEELLWWCGRAIEAQGVL